MWHTLLKYLSPISTTTMVRPPFLDPYLREKQREIAIDAAVYVAEHTPVGSLTKSVIDNTIRDTVTPIPGSILHCALFGAEHSGIYLGDGKIVELLGTGAIRVATPSQFTGSTNALTIYVACGRHGPLGSSQIAVRARKAIYSKRDYHLLFNNCHRFTSSCITDDEGNSDTLFMRLNSTIAIHLNNGFDVTWRAWDLSDPARNL